MTPDPYTASGGPADPQSWNRYAYVGGDPVNRNDRSGLCWSSPQYIDFEDEFNLTEGGDADCSVSLDPGLITLTSVFSQVVGGTSGASQPTHPSTPQPDCDAIVAAAGFSGLIYANALEIWNDGNLSKYSTDSTAATIAALAAFTWQGESSFSSNPSNNGNYSSSGALLSVDYGPLQINSHFHPNPNSAVWGTNGTGGVFNGNPDANIAFGVSILEGLNQAFGNNAAGRYVGSLGSVNGQPTNGQKRENTWNAWGSRLTGLFGNTNCFPHQ
jgi:hypothetical protein